MKKSILAGLLIAISSNSCVSTSSPNLSLTGSIYDDKSYFPVYDSHTKSYNVIQDFMTNLTIATTAIDPEFNEAFSKRYEEIYKEPHDLVSDIDKKAAYFISIYSPDRKVKKVQSAHVWNIYLNVDGKRIKARSYKRMRPKDKWKYFFPTITFWTNEYLVVFDLPGTQTKEQRLKNELVMAGPKGQISFKLPDAALEEKN